ncbi:MAG TPA: hypothetical protein VGE74_10920 [Gemmata sp.]
MLSRLATRTCLIAALTALALLASAGSAHADTVNFTGNTNNLSGNAPVSFSGSVTVTPVGGGTSSAVSITLTNTTTGNAAGVAYITGFGFNLPGTTLKASGAASSDTDFKFLNSVTNTTSLQAGEFDYAYSLSSTELHTVDRGLSSSASKALISKGLGAGQSATFTFTVNGSVTAAQIVTDTSGSGVPLSVRFRSTNTSVYLGHNDPDGDKVPASVVVTPPPPPPSGVPAPPGVVLAGMGFGCLLLGRLRRKK